jgi:hypothetical protein
MPDVRVPQKDGSITITRNGGEPVTRHVKDHVVAVGDDDLAHFIAVTGGSLIEAKPASTKKEN